MGKHWVCRCSNSKISGIARRISRRALETKLQDAPYDAPYDAPRQPVMVTFRLGSSLLVPAAVHVALELTAPSGFSFPEAQQREKKRKKKQSKNKLNKYMIIYIVI